MFYPTDAPNPATPLSSREIVGGRYDGDTSVVFACPDCGSLNEHIIERGREAPSPRVCDSCSGTYDVFMPSRGLLDPDPVVGWRPAGESLRDLGFTATASTAGGGVLGDDIRREVA